MLSTVESMQSIEPSPAAAQQAVPTPMNNFVTCISTVAFLSLTDLLGLERKVHVV